MCVCVIAVFTATIGVTIISCALTVGQKCLHVLVCLLNMPKAARVDVRTMPEIPLSTETPRANVRLTQDSGDHPDAIKRVAYVRHPFSSIHHYKD
ncbi:MAG: hypothetical protein ACJAVO_001374 [Parvibaculaceae bacterium]|jgi:hypothetical protein